jgi:dTMP kinase
MKGTFIVVEGIDGCGKGEQIKRLHNFLFDSDKRNVVLSTREPTYGKYGLQIRKKLKEDKDPMKDGELMLDLYTKDRKDHLDTLVLPFIKRESGEMNHIVLCDRYYHSTYAFQQAQGIPFEKIHSSQKGFLKPDLTFIIDLDPKIAISRMSKVRDGAEKFEKLDFMTVLRKNYLALKEKLGENIIIINGEKSKDEVFEQILDVLKKERVV